MHPKKTKNLRVQSGVVSFDFDIDTDEHATREQLQRIMQYLGGDHISVEEVPETQPATRFEREVL